MLEHKGYIGTVNYDDEVGIFYGEVTNSKDILSFQGYSLRQVKKAFRDSIEDYLKLCTEQGQELDTPFSGRFLVRLTPEQHRKIYNAANSTHKNFDSWVVEVLEKAAEAHAS